MANHDKGRRKWTRISQDTNNYHDFMGGRRGGSGPRGPQAIYTPGSGPLKKTGRQQEDYEHHQSQPRSSVQDRLKPANFNNVNTPDRQSTALQGNSSLADKLNDVHITYCEPRSTQSTSSIKENNEEARKRNKKPEQALYVPKKIQGPVETETRYSNDIKKSLITRPIDASQSPQSWERDREWETQSNRSRNEPRRDNRPGRRGGGSDTSRKENTKRYGRKGRPEDEYRSNSPRNTAPRRDDSRRGVRQGSEPPNAATNESHRTRDTRSVEPERFDKFPRKPPSGRRPKVNALKIESLPPRLQRKYLAENGLEPVNNGDWDTPSYYPVSLPPVWTNTVPKSRGRGRFRPEELEATVLRPGTPDGLSAPSSRSHTPSQELRALERRGSNSTMCTSMESLSRVDSVLMPPPASPGNTKRVWSARINAPPAFDSLTDVPSDTLDWSEEVELSEKLGLELSRNSSALSAREVNPCSSGKKRRRDRRRGDRSHSRDRRENSQERKNNKHNRENDSNQRNARFERRIISRECSKERFRREEFKRADMEENWRTGGRISGDENGHTVSPRPGVVTPGVLVLPDAAAAVKVETRPSPPRPKTLYDPNNPHKPIVVPAVGRAVAENMTAGYRGPTAFAQSLLADGVPFIAEQMTSTRPAWYDPSSESLRFAKNACLLMGIETMDRELQGLLASGGLTANWDRVTFLRHSLQQSLQNLLETDMKFCQAENVEQHFWKILFYNIIEMLRKVMTREGPDGRELCKRIMLKIIDDGTIYFENLLNVLENTYKFKLDVFVSSAAPPKGLGFVGLALISAQKIYLFLGDLARYKEQANESTNYGKSRQWYLKAQQINPKNGRPYNQLALLAHYARRKLDAVYYYMRSLMASNPFHSARESLIALFDENRKKYVSTERKRKEEREWKERARMKEKEGANNVAGGLRREIWVHPGGRRMRRTTSTASEAKFVSSDLEELAQLSSVEVNKRFVTSYLHVHGKLINKIGMETFQEAGIQMLREFRALLQHSPLPLPGTRLLQLLALNMFAIETTQLKDCSMEQGYRSEVQERALVVSLQMFNLILERGVALLREQLSRQEQPRLVVDEDMQVLLPAIKIWCDWMLCHSAVWNPPPSCTDYRVGPPGDAWMRLAAMVNLLEKLEYPRKMVIHARDAHGRENELDLVRLPEDITLSGFTPLMSNPQDLFYALKTDDMEVAQVCLRIHKILFFGQVFLCGLETPVLKLQKSDTGVSEYVSLVEASSNSSPSSPPEQSDSELLVDSYSEDEEETSATEKRLSSDSTAGSEIRSLIERKGELERRQRRQERHRQRVQAILQKSSVSVEIEVRPRQLVPDTNCFIDYLSQLQCIAKATSGAQPLFTLMVPLVVLNELEGLARGADSRDCPPASRASLNPEHSARVAESAKNALVFLRSRNPAIRCLTTRGTVLSSSTFTVEEDVSIDGLASNDDRILATCLSLCKVSNKDQSSNAEGQPRRLRREVVLLTEDRNLRVKALARDVPVREVPDFIQWAGLG